MTQDFLGTESVGKLLLKYSIPAIIGMMVNGLYNVVDRIFIGNIPGAGPLAITGVGVTMPIMTIILAFGMLIGLGTTTNISIKLGQGKKEDAEKLIGNAITLCIIVGTIITIIGLIFVDEILSLFGASGQTLGYAKEYINIILAGSIFNMMSFTMNHSVRADGSPKISAMIMISGCVTNIILDAVFIFVFNMGIQGAALATVISLILSTVLSFVYYLSGKSNLKIRKENLMLDKKLVRLVFSIGMSPFAMQIAASMVQVISNNSLKTYGGDLAIGAMATVSSASMMLLMPIFGINQGSQPIVGYNYGAKNYDRAKKAWKYSTIIATILLTMGALIMHTFPEVIIGLFNKDPELMQISVEGIKLYTLMLPIIGISITGSNYIQSIGKAKIAMFLSLLRQVIILIPCIIILPKFFGLNGVWLSHPLADFIATTITAILLVKEMKSQDKEMIDINIEQPQLAVDQDRNV